jgi:hypothetical protein
MMMIFVYISGFREISKGLINLVVYLPTVTFKIDQEADVYH